MGNVGFLIPTQKHEDWNLTRVSQLLQERFPNFTILTTPEHGQLEILKKPGLFVRQGTVAILYFEQPCYVLNYTDDITWLEEEGKPELAQKLRSLQALDPNLESGAIQMTHGDHFKQRCSVEKFLMEYFGAYAFDEGIHPEYMPPDFQFKPENLRE